MKFIETPIPGAFVIELERIEDERGCPVIMEGTAANQVAATVAQIRDVPCGRLLQRMASLDLFNASTRA